MLSDGEIGSQLEPSWKCPAGPVNVWKVVEADDGTGNKMRVSIQDVPKDPVRREEVIQLMLDHYLADETISSYLNLKSDPLARKDLRVIWNYCMSQGITVGAYKLGESGELLSLIGVNLLYVCTPETIKDVANITERIQSPNQSKMIRVLWDLWDRSNEEYYKVFGEGPHIVGWGMFVAKQFRGQKLGVELLEARNKIGQKYKIPSTRTIFTSATSQSIAQRAGFVSVFEIDYDKVVNDAGVIEFPGLKEKTLKIMAKRC
uniref:N-acetyltransferase domain-containing protein n=1 Tax=Cuerna arida TaxID=1464854 RepID=A0A1B6ERW8_9HEMI